MSSVLLKWGFIWSEKSVLPQKKRVHFGLKSQCFATKKAVIFKLENKDEWVREPGLKLRALDSTVWLDGWTGMAQFYSHMSRWPEQMSANKDKQDRWVGEVKGDWAVMDQETSLLNSQWSNKRHSCLSHSLPSIFAMLPDQNHAFTGYWLLIPNIDGNWLLIPGINAGYWWPILDIDYWYWVLILGTDYWYLYYHSGWY